MSKSQLILKRLQRTTSSGKFIPEIDGLRFIAIASVILYHLHLFLGEKNHHVYNDGSYPFIGRALANGYYGVPLFFAISGFILALPFARHYIQGATLPSLKHYFIRRITRLEPPYILVMIMLFLANVFVVHKYTLEELFPSLAASLTYTHNLVYGKEVLPLINVVAWSLEIEVQFYIIAPLLALLFKLRVPWARRCLIVGAILIFVMLQHFYQPAFRSLYNDIQFFLIGFLLVDFYLVPRQQHIPGPVAIGGGCVLLASIWLVHIDAQADMVYRWLWAFILPFIIFLFYYLVFFTSFWKEVFSNQWLTTIGGMCYSIYLLHYAIISMIGNYTVRFQFTRWYFLDSIIHGAILLVFILMFSSVFFVLIERPCMKKDWYKQLFKKAGTALSA
ncbi:acyltransferase [uncultured Chitinophaga sp.]|jgi:Predicted acyltransferases|uniref:acyltransferase family protein n=1 Tax=uncultured Chitinophaga sp. TaxID=339340 RepID=UPI00260EA86F|nr:acyltransferase [uncultured Chitinophaga sp.]